MPKFTPMDPPPLREYRYKGHLIRECENPWDESRPHDVHLGRWIVQLYHYITREPLPDRECTHHDTIAGAKENINYFEQFPARKR